MNATFESALDYMDETMLGKLQQVLALDMSLVMVTSDEPGPPGWFYLLPGEDATMDNMKQFAAIMQGGDQIYLSSDEQREMLETVNRRLDAAEESDDDDY